MPPSSLQQTPIVRRPPKRLSDLGGAHSRYRNSKFLQFGLVRLIIATNLAGIAMGVIVMTRGAAIPIAIAVGVVLGSLVPGIVFLVLSMIELRDRFFGRPTIPLASEVRKRELSRTPFDD